jgi:uncharacterized protein YndB with AHSA1/START domain
MKTELLEISAAIQILKPANEVFEAIVDPDKMSNYFISKGSGRMEEGKNLMWSFPEYEGEFPIRTGAMIQDELISFYWEIEGKELLVSINLSPYKEAYTIVKVTESGMENTEAGIKWLKGNTEGWANFLACLKAWMEYGIHLRKGAFDFRFEKK